jgi:DNA-binding NtrC family response regulator
MQAPHIMLVDDEIPFVETLAKRLKVREIVTETAFSGKECLDKLDALPDLDVIILDVKMPGMDGLETLRTIKSLLPMVEVIMLTGHGTIESAIEGMKQGAYDYLLKPCEIDIIVDKIKDAARRKREQEAKIEEAKKQETLAKYGPFYYA